MNNGMLQLHHLPTLSWHLQVGSEMGMLAWDSLKLSYLFNFWWPVQSMYEYAWPKYVLLQSIWGCQKKQAWPLIGEDVANSRHVGCKGGSACITGRSIQDYRRSWWSVLVRACPMALQLCINPCTECYWYWCSYGSSFWLPEISPTAERDTFYWNRFWVWWIADYLRDL